MMVTRGMRLARSTCFPKTVDSRRPRERDARTKSASCASTRLLRNTFT